MKKWLLVGLFTGSVILNGVSVFKNIERWRVVKVVDGDTLWLKEDRIRFSGIDAPEQGECKYEEAREQLARMAENRIVKFKFERWDEYNRKLGVVKIGKTDVSYELLVLGLGKYEWSKIADNEKLKAARDEAKKLRIGVWSRECGYREGDEESDSGCVIKGNSRHGKGKIYTLPECPNYGQITIEPDLGDKWFCTQEEAEKEGFVKSGICK